jgi:hypothetical protein
MSGPHPDDLPTVTPQEGMPLPPATEGPPPAAAQRPSDDGTLPLAEGSRAPAGEHRTIPGYEILAEVGRGGMGVVYKARQVALNRLVAVKMILGGALAGPETLARFRSEAEVIARLEHPNIVQIHDVGEHEGRPFFTMEFVPGDTLARKLVGTPWKARRAAALVEKLAGAVHVMHGQGVLHRDLKPANILLAANGEPKITDFGLAKQMEGGAGRTASGAVLGTPSYMAPEQAGSKKKDVGPAADVYSLGAILYELLTGRPPFQAETPLDTLLLVVSEEPPPPRQLLPKLSRDLEAICLKCLRKQPAERYASAEELADDLGRFLDGAPVRARRLSGREMVGRWLRQRLGTKLLLGVAAVYLLLAAVVDAWTNASYSAVPLLVLVLVPFLWPRLITIGVSLSLILVVVCIGLGVHLFRLLEPPGPKPAQSPPALARQLVRGNPFVPGVAADPTQLPTADIQWAALEIGLSIGRGLLVAVVGLGAAVLLGRARLVTTLGVLFGFAVGYRSLAAGLLLLVTPGPSLGAFFPFGLSEQARAAYLDGMLRTRLLDHFAMPDLLGSAVLTLSDPLLQLRVQQLGANTPPAQFLAALDPELLARADTTAVVSAVLLIVTIGLLPAGIGALIGGALAERRPRRLRWVQKTALAAGGAALLGVVLWAGSVSADLRAQSKQLQDEMAQQNRVRQNLTNAQDFRQVISKNNLTQVTQALRRYHDSNNRFPPAASVGKDGRPLLSWRVLLLPFLSGDAPRLYKVFNLDEPWDSPHNRRLLGLMPQVFRAPTDGAADSTTTFYQVFVGPGSVFEPGPGISQVQIRDGVANTFLVVEGAEAVPWTKPQDLEFAARGPLPKLGGMLPAHGFHAGMADGRVYLFKKDALQDEPLLRALIGRDDGVAIDWERLRREDKVVIDGLLPGVAPPKVTATPVPKK